MSQPNEDTKHIIDLPRRKKPERPFGCGYTEAHHQDQLKKWREEIETWDKASKLKYGFNPDQLGDFFIATPYLARPHYGYRVGMKNTTRWVKFVPAMRFQAYCNGAEGIGRAVLQSKEPPRTNDGSLVLAIGRFGTRKFVITSPDEHKNSAYRESVFGAGYQNQFAEYDWPADWNNTGNKV